MAPELWHDKPCSKKSDMWAMGVILYELCTREYPYDAPSVDELKNKVIESKAPAIPGSVGNSFGKIIRQCLQKKPELRPDIEKIIASDKF
jgi:NIMA (never in mitosis gene a)-related kinase